MNSINRTIVVERDSRELTTRVIEVLNKSDSEGVFASRNEFLATPILVDVNAVRAITGDEVYDFLEDPDGPIRSVDGKRWKPAGIPTPQHFGAMGDGITDDTDALVAFSAYTETARLGKGGTFRFPPGRYLCGEPLIFKRAAGGGPGTLVWENVELVCTFDRQYHPVFIYFGDPEAPGSSSTAMETFGKVWIEGHESITRNTPVAIRAIVQGQSIIRGVRTRNWWNTVFDYKRVQNVSIYDTIIYGGGYSFGYRDTDGSLFRRSGTTLTRVSGSFAFQASDVGKQVSLFLTDYTLSGTIQSVTDSANVVMNADFSGVDGSDRSLRFGSPAPRTTVGSPVVTLDGPVDDTMIGLTVGIPRAGSNGQTLWGVIQSVSGSTITLNRNASVALNPAANPLTETSEIATPVVFVDSEVEISTTRISQVRFFNTQIETYRGVAVGVDDAEFVDFISCKFHGVSTSNMSWNTYALGSIWGNRLSGRFIGELDQVTLGQYKFRLADQTQPMTFIDLKARMRRYEKLLRLESQGSGYEGGVASFGSFAPLNVAPNLPFSTLYDDVSGRGVVPPLQYMRGQYDDAEYYLGPGVVAGRTGNLSFRTADTWFAPVVSDAGGVAATGDFKGMYNRIGRMVQASYRLVNITTTGLSGAAILRVALPVNAVANDSRNISGAPVRYDAITTNGNLIAYVTDGGTHVTFYRHDGATGMTQLPVSALTSGAADMFFSISYMAV